MKRLAELTYDELLDRVAPVLDRFGVAEPVPDDELLVRAAAFLAKPEVPVVDPPVGDYVELRTNALPFLSGGLPHLREQPRDSHGRFDFGEGKTDSGGGVRAALADAKTVEEIASVTATELNSITGRDTAVTFHGDPAIAREHAEAILRAQSDHPDVAIAKIGTFDPEKPGLVYHAPGDKDAIALTSTYRNFITGHIESSIRFNDNFTGNPGEYRQALADSRAQGWLADPTHGGIATHEFGHAWAEQAKASTAGSRAAADHAQSHGAKVTSRVRQDISNYATTNSHELAAESFAQVKARGDSASGIARAVYDAVTSKRGG